MWQTKRESKFSASSGFSEWLDNYCHYFSTRVCTPSTRSLSILWEHFFIIIFLYVNSVLVWISAVSSLYLEVGAGEKRLNSERYNVVRWRHVLFFFYLIQSNQKLPTISNIVRDVTRRHYNARNSGFSLLCPPRVKGKRRLKFRLTVCIRGSLWLSAKNV